MGESTGTPHTWYDLIWRTSLHLTSILSLHWFTLFYLSALFLPSLHIISIPPIVSSSLLISSPPFLKLSPTFPDIVSPYLHPISNNTSWFSLNSLSYLLPLGRQLRELKNGRLAMLAIAGMLYTEALTGTFLPLTLHNADTSSLSSSHPMTCRLHLLHPTPSFLVLHRTHLSSILYPHNFSIVTYSSFIPLLPTLYPKLFM